MILSVDYGDSRTGLAVCDAQERLASAVGVVAETYQPKLVQAIAAQARASGAQMLVVGYPKNMDASIGARAQKCADLAQQLREATGLPVELWDERLTTVSAHRALNVTNTRGKKRKQIVDAVAAVMILEDFLAFRKNQGK